VLELGLVGRTAHQVDECTPLKELVALTAIYRSIIERYLA
jgi:succinyl-diaminopimelate desuccinylase